MTDRKMLELAAKAADVFLTPKTLARAFPKWKWDEDFDLRYENGQGISGAVLVYDYDGKLSGTTREVWNPLTDDGDALRLAVRLRLHACQFPLLDDGMDEPLGMVEIWRVDDDDPLHVEYLKAGDDRLAVTRRAIVRAAAEIGRGIAQQAASTDLPEDNYYKSMAEAEEIGRAAAEIGRQMP